MDDENEIKELSKHTRFRAYQIGSAGSSFSYFSGSHITLVEGRLTDHNRESIAEEMEITGKEQLDTLHITSWDQDHCSLGQLEEICKTYAPKKIQYPGYPPHTDSGKECRKFIQEYGTKTKSETIKVDPDYIDSLSVAADLTYRDIYYNPIEISDKANDNSTIKMFRSGSFSVLSMGDVESSQISSNVRGKKIVQREADILILPHHGADNGFLTKAFLKKVKPKMAVCCADFNNQFDHPKDEIRNLLHECKVDLFTTKTGDVIVESYGKKSRLFQVSNLIKDGKKISSEKTYSTKRGKLFSMNLDSLRNLRRGNFRRRK